MRKALIVWGGWEGHQPKEVADLLADLLREERFDVEVADTLDAFADAELLLAQDLIVPVWTMGTIAKEQVKPLLAAVQAGTGIAGCHGGMADAFRTQTEYQFMVGGQWVAHPGNDGVTYSVQVKQPDHPIMKGISDFEVCTEQYYLHVDPGNDVLAVTTFAGLGANGKDVEMPVAWTKAYGAGRVFYCSLGHQANVLEVPPVKEMMRRGMLWAARRKGASADE